MRPPVKWHWVRWLGSLGPGGISSFALASLTAVLGLGLPALWRLREVLNRARSDERTPADAILILGRELVGDQPTPVFRARLEQGAALFHQRWAAQVVVAGGVTGAGRRSEAAAGRELLLAAGLPPAAIHLEERSRYTLENLINVRATMRERGWQRLLLVSDPLHLARAATFARGLGLEVFCSPAVASPPLPGSRAWWLRALREAFLLHWYHVGMTYSRLLRPALLTRVT